MGSRLDEINKLLVWSQRQDDTNDADHRVAVLYLSVAQEKVEMGYVGLHKGKFYFAVTNKKLPGRTTINRRTRDCEKCCRHLKKFVASCLYITHKLKEPLPPPHLYQLSILDEVTADIARENSESQSFEDGFASGIAYALRRLGLDKLPPDWATYAVQDQSGAVTYYEEMPERNPAYGTYTSDKRSEKMHVGSDLHWFYQYTRTM